MERILNSNLGVNEKGNLTVGGIDATELAREYKTPLYVLDEELIRENCRILGRDIHLKVEISPTKRGIIFLSAFLFLDGFVLNYILLETQLGRKIQIQYIPIIIVRRIISLSYI